jgi:hypothetical protein
MQEVYHTNNVEVYIGDLRVGLDELWEMWYLCLKYLSRLPPDADFPDQTRTGFWLSNLWKIFQPICVVGSKRHQLLKCDNELRALAVLTGMFRAQEASDPRDKLFALLGMSSDRRCFEADYNLPCRDVYVNVTRKLLATSTYPLLQVEAVSRLVSSDGLPSWVPDYALRQPIMAQTFCLFAPGFAAAPPKKEPILAGWSATDKKDDGIFCLHGVYVAIVTGICTKRDNNTDGKRDLDEVTLIRYNEDPGKRHSLIDSGEWLPDMSEPEIIMATSWGPSRTQVGDIIVVTEGSPIPLVLRADGKFYLLVGSCWLIVDRITLQDSGPFLYDFQLNTDVNGKEATTMDDPGFSDIMRGKLWANPRYFDGAESI